MKSNTAVNANECANEPILALRPRQTAKALNISERTLSDITADPTKGVPHLRVGKCVLYPVRSLEVWLARQAKETAR